MIQLIKEIETKLKQLKQIGNQDTLHMQLHSDGSGFLICREIKNGKVKDYKVIDFDNLAAFILKGEQILGKEITWRDS